VLYTDNGGLTWNPRSAGINVGLDAIAFPSATLGWAVGNAGAVFRTKNGGLLWVPEASNTAEELNDVFFASPDQGWAVGFNGTIIFRGTLAAIDPPASGPPNALHVLARSYPNPFIAATTIEFGLPSAGRARLAIYDGLGREVAVLAEGERAAGSHRVIWAAQDLASGVYFYRLDTAGKTLTRKLILSR
jgi:hypothetical protein